MSRRTVSTIVFASLLVGAVAEAQPAPRRAAASRAAASREGQAAEGEAALPVPVLSDLPDILTKLRSNDAARVREAIDLLTVLDRPESIAPLAELLRSGQPDAITDRALEALAALAKPESIEVLAEFTHHRRESVRRRAYQALAAIRDPRVPSLIEQGLRDSERNVRSACALALGDIGSRGSIEILFRAFDRGVLEAATSIGKLGDAAAVTRFSGSLGSQPLSVMLNGYEQFVRRTDLSEQVKLDIVGRLGEVSGVMVKTFLRQYLGTFAERDRSQLRRAIEETIRRIPDAPQGTTGGAR